MVTLPLEGNMEEGAGKGSVVPWRHRKMFWAWSRIFGGFIFAGVASIPIGIIIHSISMVVYGVGFIALGLAFAFLVNVMTKYDP